MVSPRGCVVVGGGLAAATLVQTLREGGFSEPVTLIGEESDRPYERPALSKDYLQGRTAAGDLYVHPEGWYANHQVRTRFGETVTEIDPRGCSVGLRSGETVGYSQLVLATGASPRTPSLPGVDLAEVYTLRRIGQAEALRAAFSSSGRRLVVIGAGWIGLEVAASARTAGCEVTVLEAADVPLARVLGPRLGRHFADVHRQHGVDLRTRTQVTAILGREGRVTGVETSGGVVPADLVLVAVGVTPETGLAYAAGLTVDNGIAVDEQLRTRNPAILAIGDVANAHHPLLGHRLRVEHWDNAIRQGRLAAGTILGEDGRYDWQPYFYTDQYDLGMEYVGHSRPEDEVVLRGDVEDGAFLAFWLRDGTVTAAMNLNLWDVNDPLRALVGRSIPADRLGDEGTDLAAL
jgi:3-phenylpropionate/trans-cinnamate dioxygenase ferredoxin reductase component